MDTGPVPAVAMPLVAVVVMCAPVGLAWLVLATLARADRNTRTDLIGGFGCGLLAAGAATAVGAAAHWSVGMTEPERLTLYVPIVEETLKALGIVAAPTTSAVRALMKSEAACRTAGRTARTRWATSATFLRIHSSSGTLPRPGPGRWW